MTLTEYRQFLETPEKQGLGDLPVMKYWGRDITLARCPLPAYIKVKQPRESLTKVWQSWDGEKLKGKLVLIL